MVIYGKYETLFQLDIPFDSRPKRSYLLFTTDIDYKFPRDPGHAQTTSASWQLATTHTM
jgi:hypothetical protein